MKIPALTDGDHITLLESKSGGTVGRDVLVPLLETVVLGYVVKVVTTHNDGPLHLRGDNNAPQDTAANADITGERALFVDVLAFYSLLGCLEAKTNVLDETEALALSCLLS